MSTAPNQEGRKKCWASRDDYWSCLELSGEDKSKCERNRKLFESCCSKTWVKYFDRQRDYTKFKDKVEKEGYESIGKKKS